MKKRKRQPRKSTKSARQKGPAKQRGHAATRCRDWKPDFLAALVRYSNVMAAARVAVVDRETVYNHREDDPAFALAWEEALKRTARRERDRAEEELDERTYRGIPEPVIYQGAPCFTAATAEGEWCPDDDPRALKDGDGNVLKIPMVLYRKDFAALAMKLKAAVPEKYRDRVQVQHDNLPGPRTPDERASEAAALLAELRAEYGGDVPADPKG